jgi:hypothetical protein
MNLPIPEVGSIWVDKNRPDRNVKVLSVMPLTIQRLGSQIRNGKPRPFPIMYPSLLQFNRRYVRSS